MPTISEPLILETSFLRKAKYKFSFEEDLTQGNKPIRAIKQITILPFSEACLTGQIKCIDSLLQSPDITEKFQANLTRPSLRRALVNPKIQNRHPVVLLNTSSNYVKIYKSEIVPLFRKSKESDFIEPQRQPTNVNSETDYIPHSINAIKESVAHDAEIDHSTQMDSKITLTTEEQNCLDNLLKEYEDIFVGKDGKIGLTNLYEHTIELKPDAIHCHF